MNSKLVLMILMAGAAVLCTPGCALSSPSEDPCGAHYVNGNRLMDSGEYKEALAEFTAAIRCGKYVTVSYACRAAAYSKLGDHKSALGDCNAAIELDPSNVLAYMNRCCEYVDLGNGKSALEDGNKAIALNSLSSAHYSPRKPQTLFLNRGRAFFILGDLDNSLSDFNKAIELDPNYAVAYHNRAIAYRNTRIGPGQIELKNAQQAKADFQRAADLYSQSGNTQAAETCLSEIAKLQSGN